MKIISWNVNGIRAVMKKGFVDWFEKEHPDVLCIQETKAFESQLPPEIHLAMQNYDYVWHEWTRPWYAWTAIFYKKSLNLVDKKSHFESMEHFHEDGRVVETVFDLWFKKPILLLNLYFPNGGMRANGDEMLTYKLEFYDRFLHYIQNREKAWYYVITCGDFNVCHHSIDIARPEANKNSIWFLPEERAKLTEIQDAGFVDVFRFKNPEAKDRYTWWSYRAGSRPRNVWRRLDYFWVSQEIVDYVKHVDQLDQVMGSDHCPIVLELNV